MAEWIHLNYWRLVLPLGLAVHRMPVFDIFHPVWRLSWVWVETGRKKPDSWVGMLPLPSNTSLCPCQEHTGKRQRAEGNFSSGLQFTLSAMLWGTVGLQGVLLGEEIFLVLSVTATREMNWNLWVPASLILLTVGLIFRAGGLVWLCVGFPKPWTRILVCEWVCLCQGERRESPELEHLMSRMFSVKIAFCWWFLSWTGCWPFFLYRYSLLNYQVLF